VELSVTPQPGYVGEYMQYLFEATVPTEALARHTAGLVDCVDPEGVRLESTCFDRRSVERMPDFMPKHLDMLQKANSKADA
jgi:hypothetical protein